MNAPLITGGGPAGKKIIMLTDFDMNEVEKLMKAGNELSENHIVEHNQRVASRRGKATKAAKYRDYIDAVSELKESGDPRVVKAWFAANSGLTRLKDIAPGTVHQNATLSNLSVQYANEAYIGEEFLPVIQVGKQSDVWYTYNQRDRLNYPDDELGPRSQANEIQEGRATDSYACVPYGYENFVSAMTLANQDTPLNEMIDLVEAIAEGLAFRRELRCATTVTTVANYSGNSTTVAAADRWDTATGGDPIKNLQDATAGIWLGRGPSDLIAGSSLAVYQVLSRHPAILDLFKYNGSSPGLATPDMIARFFDIDRYLVGKARKDTAKEGQSASYSRIWPDRFWITRVARRASIRNAVFGYIVRHGQPVTLQWYDQRVGHGGGYYAKVSVSEVNKIVASPTGWIIDTPIG